METTDTQRRERRTIYYVAQKPTVFKTKKEVEKFLTEQGGLKDDQILVKGATVEAEKKEVFKLA